MHREKATGKRTKLRAKFTLIALVLISIILSACPPLEEDPHSNTIKIPEEYLTLEKWMEILIDIHERGIPVNLDLSRCKVPDYGADVLKNTYNDGTDYYGDNGNDKYTQFDPIPGFPFGKEFILSLILPKDATMIKNATDIDITLITDEKEEGKKSAFRHFTNLRSITGENIELIGTLAFIDCKKLEEANFKKAVHIMPYAFYGCTGLKKVEFEVARELQISAFENCTNLEKAILPYTGTISERAFKNCRRLTEVNFDVAASIGDEAFRDCISLKYARFRADDSIIFNPNAFRGCRSLQILDVRYACNVYFSGGALADIGERLDLFLFDDDGTKSLGHPQTDMFLGDIEESEDDNGVVTLKTLLIIAPIVTPPEDSKIEKSGIFYNIRAKYSYDSGKENEEGEPILSYYIDVTIQRSPALLN